MVTLHHRRACLVRRWLWLTQATKLTQENLRLRFERPKKKTAVFPRGTSIVAVPGGFWDEGYLRVHLRSYPVRTHERQLDTQGHVAVTPATLRLVLTPSLSEL